MLLHVVLHRLGPGAPVQPGTEQHQAADPAWSGERDVDAVAAAHGAADQQCPLDGEGVHQGEEVLGVGVFPHRVGGVAVAAPVVAHDPVVLREVLELVVPHAPVGQGGVREDDGRPVAFVVVGEPGAVDLDVPHGSGRYRRHRVGRRPVRSERNRVR